MNHTKLRMTGRQHAALFHHLFPGDGKESVALALCGVGEYMKDDAMHRAVSVHRIVPVPHDACVRSVERVTWPTHMIPELLQEAAKKRLVLLKIHSHPTGWPEFSGYDDLADRELFQGVAGWLDTEFPGVSAIMLPDGQMISRTVDADGVFGSVAHTVVAGADIRSWHSDVATTLPLPFMKRTQQAFGKGTTTMLSQLSIGLVGVSGTGSPVAEMLYRLGVGELLLVDGDKVEEKNLNRIYNSAVTDAASERYKVEVQVDAMDRGGLPTRAVGIPNDLFHPEVVRRLAQCDVIFGCMDSVDGRDLLNRLCSCYCIPYFDLGVRIDADGEGGVDQACGTVHYVQPDGSSLLSRGVYSPEQLRAAMLRRLNPDEYRQQVEAKYIKGVAEDRPAVVSLNTLIAALAVNDFLARVHPFRDQDNTEIAVLRLSLVHTQLFAEAEGPPCTVHSRFVGRGDMKLLLNMVGWEDRRE